MPLLAGADARTIHPSSHDRPVFLAGFSRNRRATGVHDPLMVRTIALSDGRATFVLAMCDVIGLLRNDTLDIRRRLTLTGEPHVVVACTHTHSGPDTLGLWGPDEQTTGYDNAYVEFLKARVADSVVQAVTSLRPAGLRAAMCSVPGIVRNFRDPHIVDHELAVLQATTPSLSEGGARAEVIFTLLNFPCHPEVMDDDNMLITADMAGYACRAIEREVGGVGVWASGHLGGMMSPDTAIRTFGECERMGETLAVAALTILRIGSFAERAELAGMMREVDIPLHNPLLRLAAAVGLLRGVGQGESVTTEVSVWRIGDLVQFVFVPGELLPKLGMQLKAHMTAGAKFVVGLANDEIGYILPREDFIFPQDYMDPGRQYEESMSLGPDAEPTIVDTLIQMLRTTRSTTPK